MAVVSLTTDFGSSDFEIGSVSAVVLSRAPEAKIADLTHDVPPQNVLDAAVILSRHVFYFPPNSVHVVVVDPGVGTIRRPIAAQLGDQYFVGPDNGVMTLLYQYAKNNNLPIKIVHTNKSEFWLSDVSNIFHGRDIFASVGGFLAAGYDIEDLGEVITDPVLLDIPQASISQDYISGQIMRIDHFGNLESNIDQRLLKGREVVSVQIKNRKIDGLVKTFGDKVNGELVSMIDSSGVISVCVVNGSAANDLQANTGDTIELSLKIV